MIRLLFWWRSSVVEELWPAGVGPGLGGGAGGLSVGNENLAGRRLAQNLARWIDSIPTLLRQRRWRLFLHVLGQGAGRDFHGVSFICFSRILGLYPVPSCGRSAKIMSMA